jgi:Kef-type K+ transport system membrane component KefB
MMTIQPLPTLDANGTLLFLIQLGSLLTLALTLGGLARRMGLPAVVGELLAGILIGPSLLGWAVPGLSGWLSLTSAGQVHLLDAVGLVAVLLLVGLTGVHMDLGLLRRRKAVVVTVSLGGLIVPLTLGIAAGFLMPGALLSAGANRVTFAVFMGVAMCVSAIPVIAKILSDMRLLHSSIGQLILSSATVDDAVGWFLLSLVSAMSTSGLRASSIARSALLMIGFVGFAWLVGRPLVNLIMRAAARSPEPGPVTATAAVVVLAGGAASQALGLEPVFGAFIAGILVGSSPATDRQRLEPLRSVVLYLLAPVFLATVGLRVNLTALANPAVLAAGVVVLAIAVAGKFIGAYTGARLGRLSRWEGTALGAGLNARGVVEIVIASVGLRLGVLSTAMYTIVVMVAVVTSLATPPLLRWAMSHLPAPARDTSTDVVVPDDALLVERGPLADLGVSPAR